MALTAEEEKGAECIWSPTGKQREFLGASYDEVLYGGSAGGGKTDAMLIDMLGLGQNALNWSRYRAILFRRTFPELSELVDRSREVYPAIYPGATYVSSEHEWRFPSGAKIMFGYMDKDEDRFRHQGIEYQWVGWDELTHWATPVCYKYLQSRTRSTNPDVRCFTRATTNPGGRGHAWVKKYWQIPNDGLGTKFADVHKVGKHKAVSYRQFIPARLEDNPFLNESGYREMLMRMPDKERKKLLDGRWDVVEGQFFTIWDPAKHIVKPFAIPRAWPRWRAMDWGSTKPFSIGWYAMDEDGVVYRYRELYGWGGEADVGTQQSPRQVSKIIHEYEKDEKSQGVEFKNNPADCSMWYARGEGVTVGELFKNEGVSWVPTKSGPGSRSNGWVVCNDALETGKFKVFDTCEHFIRTVPIMQIDPARPEDVETKYQEDHVADEWRYAMVSRHKFKKQEAKPSRPGYMTYDYIVQMDEQDRADSRSVYRF
jgi:hypothetical protein